LRVGLYAEGCGLRMAVEVLNTVVTPPVPSHRSAAERRVLSLRAEWNVARQFGANGLRTLAVVVPAMLRQFGLRPRAAFICPAGQDTGSIGAGKNYNKREKK